MSEFPEFSTDELVRWLQAKYRRHSEIEDGVAAERLKELAAEVINLRELASMVWVNSTINSPEGTDYRVPSDHMLALRDYVRTPHEPQR